ncbi:hypothetical protein HYG77_09820 [Rhodococcus sp. ZPP]|uniref:hypothetical protein n=1 Tax=Rhodococcus sp. ZPP TaxID=2749906 RepID=UPI001AD856E8|nr:hypothetical protein [Rhodococcus sp. ZPP]QTJ65861.1 hypothetical protein HYG77_09820 [Rhodococcus sp. ZPP]
MSDNPTQGHPALDTHYDETTGDFVMRGGSRLTPQGFLIDPYGERRDGSIQHRIRSSDGAIVRAIPVQDGADPRPLPPLVPTGSGWPTPPEGFGWPNLDNPNWND